MIDVIKHHFAGGVYAKEVIIKDGFKVDKHVHNFDHMSILAQGQAIIDVDGVKAHHIAPSIIEIKAGKQHSVTALNGDVLWYCIHSTDCEDIDKIDKVLVSRNVDHMNKMDLVFNTKRALDEINHFPDLWNRYTIRTSFYEDSPHREVEDIWLRYRDFFEFDEEHPEEFAGKHKSVWYSAINFLPAVRKIIDEVMLTMPTAELGGVLITKIAPGKQVYRHSDAGFWHSEYYRTKVLVLLQSAPGQTFCFDNKSYPGLSGEVFKFNNLVDHWVENNSDVDRVSLILAVKER